MREYPMDSEARFRSLFDQSADAYLILDNNIFVDCNQATVEMLHASSKEEVLATHPSQLSPEYQPDGRPSDEKADEMISIALERGSNRFEWIHRRVDGEDFPVEVLLTPIPMEDRTIIHTVWRDVTERKELEEQVRLSMERRGYQVQISTQIAQEIAAAPALDELFKRVVTLVKERLGYYHAQILRYEPGLDAVVLVEGYGEIGERMLADGHQMEMGIGLVGSAAATGETYLRPNVLEDPTWQPNLNLPDTKGEIAVPIKLGDQVQGVLDVQSSMSGALSEDDQLLLEGLCGQIASAMEGTRLRQEMEERLSELNVLYRATSRDGWQTYRDEVGLTDGYIYDRIGIQAADVWTPEMGKAVRSGNLIRPDTGHELGQSAAVAPLSVRDEVIGALGVYDDPKHPLSQDELHLIEQVSDQVAQALESARLFGQTQGALSETQTLYEGSARVINARNLDEVLRSLTESVALKPLYRTNLVIFDSSWEGDEPPKTGVLAAIWVKEDEQPREPVGTIRNFEQYPLIKLFDRNEATVITDVNLDQRVDPNARALLNAQGGRGLIILPLVSGGEWFGFIAGFSAEALKLSKDDIRRMKSLSEQAASVIQGLRLQEEMQERLRELTSLQRLMSREAWAAYQIQSGEENLGYHFDQVQIKPLAEDKFGEPTLVQADGVQVGAQQEAGTITMAAIPEDIFDVSMTVRGEPIGVLGVRNDPDRDLSEEDEIFLRAISDQVAQAMERARLIEQTQKSSVELQAVAEVSTATSTILDPNELLQEVVNLTKDNFGLYHAHIYLVDEVQTDLGLASGAGEIGRRMVDDGWSIPVQREDSIVARAATSRQGQIIPDVRREPGFLPNPLLPDTLSEMAVPMIVGEKLLGVFDVQADRVNRFAAEDVNVFTTLASQVSVALQNAQLYAEQIETVERLRELDNMKSAFLANMSHELRTPLNSILGFAQVILEGLDGPLTDSMTSDMELIERNGQHLLRLINDVLDMAKIEAGRLSLEIEPINLHSLFDEVIVSSSPLARDKDLYIRLEANPSDDWEVAADHVRLRQIAINLLGNSVKFTDTGGVTIDLERIPASDPTTVDRVQVRIQDTGIGIPKEELETVFEAFSRVDSSTTRKAGGTGLGLPISRRLVEMLDGRLWAESDSIPGKGSTFFLELPVEQRALDSMYG